MKSSADFFEKTRVQNSNIFFSVNQHRAGFGVRLKTGKFLCHTIQDTGLLEEEKELMLYTFS